MCTTGMWTASQNTLRPSRTGEIRLLLINVPPGHVKSLSCSVFWPTWLWTRKPSVRFLGTSYSEDLALEGR